MTTLIAVYSKLVHCLLLIAKDIISSGCALSSWKCSWRRMVVRKKGVKQDRINAFLSVYRRTFRASCSSVVSLLLWSLFIHQWTVSIYKLLQTLIVNFRGIIESAAFDTKGNNSSDKWRYPFFLPTWT